MRRNTVNEMVYFIVGWEGKNLEKKKRMLKYTHPIHTKG